MGWGASAYKELHSAASKEEKRSGFNPQRVPTAGPGAVLGWLNALRVLLSAPAAAVPQGKVCKDTLALPTAAFGLGTRGVCACVPQIPLQTSHSRAGHPCYRGDGSRGDVGRVVLGR